MIAKRYDNDWAKSKSRDLVRDMISGSLLKFRKPKNVKVLCFPGVDATEITEVYDPLGIPRENIVGVERDPRIADEIEKKGLGIRVERGTIEDYAERISYHDFDVVSLDYIGPISVNQVKTLLKLFSKQSKHHMVLHTANLLRRDGNSDELYNHGYVSASIHDDGISLKSQDLLSNIGERIIHLGEKKEQGQSYTEEKKQAYSGVIDSCFGGITVHSNDKLFKFVLKSVYDKAIFEINSTLIRSYGKEARIDRDSPFSTLLGAPISPFIQAYLEESAYSHFKRLFSPPNFSEDKYRVAWTMLTEVTMENKFFRKRDAVRYSYVSESAAPMIGDVSFLSYPERAFSISEEFSRKIGYPDRISIHPHQLGELNKLVIKYANVLSNFRSEEEDKRVRNSLENRIFLGSSSKPVLTRDIAVAELEEGTSIEDIRSKYRGGKKVSLPQLKAHVTMRERKSVGENGETGLDVIVEKPIIDEDKLSKGEVIDLIASQIPLEEIHQAFPYLTMPQLRAYDHHLRKGKYKDVLNQTTNPENN
jgi:hypothetical protein